MGNHCTICQSNNPQKTSFQSLNIEINQGSTLKIDGKQKLQQFLLDNHEFFTFRTDSILHILLRDDDFQEIIKKFPFEIIEHNKKIYLPSRIIEQASLYRGQCIFLDSEKLQFYYGQIDCGFKIRKGTLIDRKGNKYEGQWQDSIQNGIGKLSILYPKRIYQGCWQNGKLEGHGNAIYQDGAKYCGNFHQGKRSGKGTLTFSDGAVYEGAFQEDLMHGFGTLTSAKGQEILGEWKQGKYQKVKTFRQSRAFSINS